MVLAAEKASAKLAEAQKILKRFTELLEKTNKEQPNQKDVRALANLLTGNEKLELWRSVASAGYVAELTKCHRECHYPGWREGVLEAKASSSEAGFGIQQLAYLGTTFNSTCCALLAEAKHNGTDLCGRDEAFNHFEFGYVLGEAIECSSEKVYSRL